MPSAAERVQASRGRDRYQRWQRARNSTAWGWGAAASVVLLFVLLRAAARQDRWVGPEGSAVHTHAGLFLGYGLLALLPALVAAVAGRGLRWLNITAVVTSVILAALCEVFVSSSVSFTF